MGWDRGWETRTVSAKVLKEMNDFHDEQDAIKKVSPVPTQIPVFCDPNFDPLAFLTGVSCE